MNSSTNIITQDSVRRNVPLSMAPTPESREAGARFGRAVTRHYRSMRAAGRRMGHTSAGPLHKVIRGERRLTEWEAISLSFDLGVDVATFGIEIVRGRPS